MDVEVTLSGTLAARAGMSRARIHVDDDATVADVVEALGDVYDPRLPSGVIDDGALHDDVVAVDESTGEPLSVRSELDSGVTVRLQLDT